MFLSILSEWIFITSFQPSIQKAESTWASGWYLNNSPCYFYIHFMSFHDSGLFSFFIPSIDLGARLHSTLPPVILLVNSYSCSKTFLRAASSFVGSSIPSMYHLCFFIALYSDCILLSLKLSQSVWLLSICLLSDSVFIDTPPHFYLCIRAWLPNKNSSASPASMYPSV